MAAQRGKDLLLKIDDGTGTFVTLGGLRSRKIALDADLVDITHSESVGRWRELLDGAGMRKATLSGSGLFKDSTSDALARQVFFDGLIRNWQVIIPDFGVMTGLFQLSALEYKGEHNGEVTFDLTLQSAGALTFTTA